MKVLTDFLAITTEYLKKFDFLIYATKLQRIYIWCYHLILHRQLQAFKWLFMKKFVKHAKLKV